MNPITELILKAAGRLLPIFLGGLTALGLIAYVLGETWQSHGLMSGVLLVCLVLYYRVYEDLRP